MIKCVIILKQLQAMKQLKLFTFIIIFSCITTITVRAQGTDERLWDMWVLEAVEITNVNRSVQKHSFDALLANKNLLPVNMFSFIVFSEDRVEVDIRYAEMEFTSEIEQSLKGTFATDNDQLVITLRGKQPRTYTYLFENENLIIRFSFSSMQFSLVYKSATQIR